MENPFPHVIGDHGCLSSNLLNSPHSTDPSYIMKCAINSVLIGTLILVVALSWAEFSRIVLNRLKKNHDELATSFYYSLFLTLVAIILAFLLMYHYPSVIW